MAEATDDPRIGKVIAGYRIEERVGRGGMGVVYRAEHLNLRRRAAIKIIAPDLAESEGFRERFTREARIAAALQHPNIVTVYDAGEVDGLLYLAMQYIEGNDLSAVLRRDGRLRPYRAVDVCRQVASALDAAHAMGLIHRDVKPANVLIEGRTAFLTDFGLTKRLDGNQTELTRAGDVVGTIHYVAPEQIEGHKVSARTDVYSLACLLYHCLSGQVPFPRDTDVAVIYAHLSEDPPKLSVLRPELPEGLDAVMAKALDKSPDRRFPACGDLINAARAVIDAAGPLSETSPPRSAGERESGPGLGGTDREEVGDGDRRDARRRGGRAPPACAAGRRGLQHPRGGADRVRRPRRPGRDERWRRRGAGARGAAGPRDRRLRRDGPVGRDARRIAARRRGHARREGAAAGRLLAGGRPRRHLGGRGRAPRDAVLAAPAAGEAAQAARAGGRRRVIAAVLAGGRSRRMGRAKAVVPLGGRPLVCWPLATAARAGLEAVVVAKPGSELPELGVPVWHEPDAISHPLAGLVCALERAGGPVVALACDMPFVTADLVARLAAAPATAAVADQPFPGRYDPSALPVLRDALEREAPVREALAALGPVAIAAEERELAGINTPEELAAASLRLMTAEQWIEAFAAALGRPAPDEAETARLLELASVAAHASERRAAPIACWLAANAGMSAEQALELARRIEA